jgi:hypothetical protein
MYDVGDFEHCLMMFLEEIPCEFCPYDRCVFIEEYLQPVELLPVIPCDDDCDDFDCDVEVYFDDYPF